MSILLCIHHERQHQLFSEDLAEPSSSIATSWFKRKEFLSVGSLRKRDKVGTEDHELKINIY